MSSCSDARRVLRAGAPIAILWAALVAGALASSRDAHATTATPPAPSPVLLRVGLATDLDRFELCCDARWIAHAGTEPVSLSQRLRVEPSGDLRGTATYRLQVAALKDEQQARGLADHLRHAAELPTDAVFDAETDLYRVRVGRFPNRAQAEAARARLTVLGVDQAWVVSEGGLLERPALRITHGTSTRVLPGRWLRIEAPRDVGIPFRGTRYRHRLLVYLNNRGHLNVINELDLEDYLRGVVPREMGPELYHELEALKAQTVAARTFTVRNLGEFRDEGYDICSTPRCQVYGGMNAEHPRSDRAIRETTGQVLLQDGAPAETFYSATCGGHTENVEVVFPRKEGAHLRGVPCVEQGPVALAGAPTAGGFPGAVTQALLPTPPGRPAQSLSARLEHLALMAGLRVPRDHLASIERREVQRYLLSVLDLVVDPRLFGAPERLAELVADLDRSSRRPSTPEHRLARFLLDSGVLAPDGGRLEGADAERLLYELAHFLGVLSRERVAYVDHDDVRLRARRGDEIVDLPRGRGELVFRVVNDQPASGALQVAPGDAIDLLWHRQRLIAVLGVRDARPVDYGTRNSKGRWRLVRSNAKLRQSVQDRYPGFPFEGFQVLSRGASGRVGQLRLLGADGRTLMVEGLAVRWTLGLPDTWFSATPTEGGYLFDGHGWGHGVGLCQAGAFGMAARGATYREILGHYYQGIALGRRRPDAPPPANLAAAAE